MRSRHYILKFLARRGFVFRDGTNWCTPHLRWLQHLTTDNSPLGAENRLIFREYHALLMYKLQRRDELDRQIEQLAELPMLAPMIARLQCFRGISLHSSMVLATEIVDWRRFERPAQLACYLGLVCREDSSGDRQRLGSITKASNSHCRHVLVQTAWSYRHRPQTSVDLKRRQQGQPPAVITYAWKAQQRLHQRYNHLSIGSGRCNGSADIALSDGVSELHLLGRGPALAGQSACHTDMMYLRIGDVWYFLTTVIDAYSRYIVHWELLTTMTAADGVRRVAQQALESTGAKPQLVADNGSQFTRGKPG